MKGLNGFDEYIQSAMESWHCPGVAIAVVSGDKPVYTRAFGVRDAEFGDPLTPETRFPIASITKSFTAASVALLVDDGLLDWNKPVREYMPEFVLNDSYATEHITVRDMLSHRSGLPRHDLSAWRLDLPRGELVRRMRHLKFSATFRERFIYNNLMYYVVPHLVETLTGYDWEHYVANRLFGPLDMDATNFAPEFDGDVPLASGYRLEREPDGSVSDLVRVPFGAHTKLSPGGAGAIFSTLSDMSAWVGLHANAGRFGEKQIVGEENISLMRQPHTVLPTAGVAEALGTSEMSAYGLGWMIDAYRGYTVCHHGGGVEGHTLHAGFVAAGSNRDAEREAVGVVVLTNIAFSAVAQTLFYEAIDRVLGLSERDWNTRFHAVLDPLHEARGQSRETTETERIPDAPPTHGWEAICGSFEADGYPQLEVRLAGGDMRDGDMDAGGIGEERPELEARLAGSLDWLPLRHIHYNVFEWYIRDFDMRVKAHLLVNDQGEPDAISIPIEPEVEPVVFRRAPVVLSPEQRAAVEGQYEPEIEGLTFSIFASGEAVMFSQSGSSPQKMHPYRADSAVIGFKLEGSRIDAMLASDGTAERLVLKSSGMT
ncbi:MAG: serine hydrolase, partial [bacterium]